MSQQVAIITGGTGGMGLETARLLARDHAIVLCDLGADRLAEAAAELRETGATVETVVCDITDPASVQAAFDAAEKLGRIGTVVHTAGVSPQMGDAAFILHVNAIGTVNITNAALAIADENFTLVNVASIAAHMLPGVLIPRRSFPLATTDPDRFVNTLARRARLFGAQSSGIAYSFSKAFVVWYSRYSAEAFGAKGARILSVSPGTFDTTMGRLEEKSGSDKLLGAAALKRYGRPDEVAELLAFLATGKAGYLTGTDILIDGGTLAGVRLHGRSARG